MGGSLGGSLVIYNNAFLATIHMSSLSTVRNDLNLVSNPSLTFASLPKLTYIGTNIRICENNAAFPIPSGPPDAPIGGLTSFYSKGFNVCQIQQGSGACANVICP
jgi:hypothetical protein